MSEDLQQAQISVPKGEREVGIDPDKAIILDMDKIASYIQTGENVIILFDIDYSPEFETRGQFLITTNQI